MISDIHQLPNDIVHNIENYYYGMVHKEQMRKIYTDVVKKSYQLKLNNVMPFTLNEHFDFEECIQIIHSMNSCRCCERHQQHHPTVDEFKTGYVPPYPTSTYDAAIMCRCNCRHLSRLICREINDIELDFDDLGSIDDLYSIDDLDSIEDIEDEET